MSKTTRSWRKVAGKNGKGKKIKNTREQRGRRPSKAALRYLAQKAATAARKRRVMTKLAKWRKQYRHLSASKPKPKSRRPKNPSWEWLNIPLPSQPPSLGSGLEGEFVEHGSFHDESEVVKEP